MSTIDLPLTTEPSLSTELTRWRRQLHTIPETGFEEHQTSAFVARTLRALGYEVFEGIGGTGLVASLQVGTGSGVIGIRAEMDALSMAETATGRAWASTHPGKMHACGHDGHMSIVLGAARLLRERQNFDGTVRFIFQPAEEHGRGAKAMMADGLFERFPVDEIYGLHNMPGQAAGSIATRSGGIMASEDNFVIHIKGRGTHAARPHMGIDPIVIGAEIVLALQTIVSRTVERVYDLLRAALRCNRDELAVRDRSMGSLPMQGLWQPNRPISPQPFGQMVFRASCIVAKPAKAEALA